MRACLRPVTAIAAAVAAFAATAALANEFVPVPSVTIYPGDIILCGTSVGVGSMKPGSDISVEIEGIGKLSNRFE